MRGNVIGFDATANMGAISGHDGKRYTFVTMDWRSGTRPRQGLVVDFDVDGNNARQVFVLEGAATSGNSSYGAPAQRLPFGKLLFSFEGRASRYDYWVRYVLMFIVPVNLVLYGLVASSGAFYFDPYTGQVYLMDSSAAGILAVLAIVYIVELWIAIAVGAKRCHDRDKTGWFQLIALIPLVGPIWLLVELGFLRGTIGDNRFGPDPVQG